MPKEGDDNDYDLNLRAGGRIQKSIRIRRNKDKTTGDGYKWPYYDSYVPNLSMKKKDRPIVRDSIQKQYFPNVEGNFNYRSLKKRKGGIKNIEETYIERVKSAKANKRLVPQGDAIATV